MREFIPRAYLCQPTEPQSTDHGLIRKPRRLKELSSLCRVLMLSVIFLATVGRIHAQAPASRIRGPIDDTPLAKLTGNTHPQAQPRFDEGNVDPSMPMRLTLVFKMTAAQQTNLEALLAAQQQRGSAEYHLWLTPEQFGSRFGMEQTDIDKVSAWLEGKGLQIVGVPASRNMIRLRGTARDVMSAFHTEIHRYSTNGEEHFSNSSDPSVPAALADVIVGIRGLNDFRMKPRVRRVSNPKFTSGSDGSHFCDSW